MSFFEICILTKDSCRLPGNREDLTEYRDSLTYDLFISEPFILVLLHCKSEGLEHLTASYSCTELEYEWKNNPNH